jgi:hypothetical protein
MSAVTCRQSPFNRTNAVATPEQLRQYLDSLPKPPAASPSEGGVPGRLFEPSPDARRFGGGAAAAGASADQGEAAGTGLSLAHDAPLYRMSQVGCWRSGCSTAMGCACCQLCTTRPLLVSRGQHVEPVEKPASAAS